MRHNASKACILSITFFIVSSMGHAATAVKKEFLEKFPLGNDYVEWSDESGGTITFGKGKPGIVVLKGKLGKGQTLDFDYQPIKLDTERNFDLPLELGSEPREFQLNFRDEKGETAYAVFTYAWKKAPPILNIKVREKGAKSGAQKGSYEGSYPTEEWASFIWKGSRKPEEKPQAPLIGAGPWYNHFQLNGIAALPTTGGNSVSTEVSWNPLWKLSEKFTFSLNLGATVFKYDATKRFAMAEFGPLIGYIIGPVHIEVGPAVQSWFGQSGARPAGSSFINYPLSSKWFGLIDKFFGGYSIYFQTGSKVHEAKLGIGMSF